MHAQFRNTWSEFSKERVGEISLNEIYLNACGTKIVCDCMNNILFIFFIIIFYIIFVCVAVIYSEHANVNLHKSKV